MPCFAPVLSMMITTFMLHSPLLKVVRLHCHMGNWTLALWGCDCLRCHPVHAFSTMVGSWHGTSRSMMDKLLRRSGMYLWDKEVPVRLGQASMQSSSIWKRPSCNGVQGLWMPGPWIEIFPLHAVRLVQFPLSCVDDESIVLLHSPLWKVLRMHASWGSNFVATETPKNSLFAPIHAASEWPNSQIISWLVATFSSVSCWTVNELDLQKSWHRPRGGLF